jgi:hypothetical protein
MTSVHSCSSFGGSKSKLGISKLSWEICMYHILCNFNTGTYFAGKAWRARPRKLLKRPSYLPMHLNLNSYVFCHNPHIALLWVFPTLLLIIPFSNCNTQKDCYLLTPKAANNKGRSKRSHPLGIAVVGRKLGLYIIITDTVRMLHDFHEKHVPKLLYVP